MNKLIKSRSLSKINKNSLNIQPFSIEKIALSINCGNIITSIRNKYIDPKIKKKIEITSLPKKKIKKIQDKLDEEMYSARKIKYHKYKMLKESLLSPYSARELRKNKSLIKHRNEFILPSIIKNKKINASYNEIEKVEDGFISTSGMINRKRLNNNKVNKITISALINNLIKNKNGLFNNHHKKLDNIYSINDKYNLNLNLIHNYNKNKKLKLKRKLTKTGLLTNLYQKYSSVSNNINSNIKNNGSQIYRKKSDSINDDHSSNISFDLGKEISIISNNNDNIGGGAAKIFLTKLKRNNDNIDISKIINRHSNLIWSIKKNNNKILDKDKNIYINCLLSKVQSQLNRDKIIYKNNGKTIYELDKELSYRRLKNFENIINKLFVERE